MFLFRMFQFRSSDRDQETDRRRIALVRKAVHSAVADAEAEVTGLRTPHFKGANIANMSACADRRWRPRGGLSC